MFQIVSTNVAGLLTIIALWSTLTWVITYLYMAEKIRRKDETIKFLDEYIEGDEMHIQMLTTYVRDIEKSYGHVIDDYTEHYSNN